MSKRSILERVLLSAAAAVLCAACGQSGSNANGGAGRAGGSAGSGTTAAGGQSGSTSSSGGVPGSSSGGAVGATGGVTAGGSANGGTGTSMGAAGMGNAAGAGAVLGTTPSTVYNGLRGAELNAGWKFNHGDASGADQPGFDDSSWRTLDVPHDFSIELAFNSNSPGGAGAGYLDGGIGWYRKTFTLDQTSAAKKALIEFDGVYMNSEVWINGTSLGTRPYGYSSFEYDLTPYLKFDGTNNVVAVKVNNNQPNTRFYSGSGIYRNVWLTQLDPVHVPYNGVFVSTPTASQASASVAVSTDVQNQGTAATAVTVTTTISDASGATVATNDSAATSIAQGATTTVQQTLTVSSPQLWSVAAPYLYGVKVEVKVSGSTVDTYLTSLGVRSATFSATNGFSLNGQNIKLQGVNMHHDLGALGSAVNYRAIERQVQILKSMGVNAIRTSHNPPAPELLDVCDRLGMLILEEAFDTWSQAKTANDYSLYFNAWGQRDIQDMVRRDRNHPSIVIWSIGNEIGNGTVAVAKNLRDWVLAIDATRPVTWASNKMAGPHYIASDHDIAGLLDIAGYNYAGYAGDYDADHAAYPSWKLLGTEISAALRSRGIYHTPADTVTKATSSTRADMQCSSYDNETTNFGDTAEVAYTRDASRPFVAGSFLWSGFDYIGEPTPYGFPAKSSYYGAIDTAGFPKDIYYFYKSRWTTDPMVHLLPHWNWSTGSSITVYAYSNCDSVELFLNDQSLGSKTISRSTLHMEWSVPWASGTLRADCKKGGSVVAQDIVKTAGAAAKVALSADRSALRADGKDLVFVTADVQDQNGVIVPTAENSITFAVSGPAQLVGVDNGNPIDTSSYKGNARNAFSGKALAIIATSKTPGTITIQASSGGLLAGSLSVTSQ